MKKSNKLITILTILLMTAAFLPLDADRAFAAPADQTELKTGTDTDAVIDADADLQVKRANGRKYVEKDAYIVPTLRNSRRMLRSSGSTELPSFYRSDQQEWAQGITVKDQKDTQLCWTYTLATTAEYSYAKEMYESGYNSQELSPGHQGYYFFYRQNDPLGNTGGDSNYYKELMNWAEFGGIQIEGVQQMASWSGLALEEKYDSDFLSDHIIYDADKREDVWDGYIPYGADSEPYNSYDDHAILQESIFYPHGTDENTIKDLVYRYGAVSIGTTFNTSKYMSADKKAFYKYDPTKSASSLNHAVTIIGWKDDYPRTAFSHMLANGNSAPLPEHDGAWIIQNSWGENEHDSGIYYASYESTDITGLSDITALDMMPADTYAYNFQYDGTADCGDSSDPGNEEFFTVSGTSAANIYTNTTGGPIDLEAACFTVYNEGLTNYTIEVYTDLYNKKDPLSGTLACTTDYSTTTCGVKTAVLDEPVCIGTGKTFSIVFRFSGETHFGVEKQRAVFIAEVRPGESFFRASDSKAWKDISQPEGEQDYGACFRIKGFANRADAEPEPDPEAEKKIEQQKQYEEEVSAAKKLNCTLVSVTAKKGRKILVKWKKNSKADGYQVKYSTDKNFSKNVKYVYAKNAKTVTKTLTKLTKGKRYYVKVRTYRKITNKATGEMKTVYGKWSKWKSAKARK